LEVDKSFQHIPQTEMLYIDRNSNFTEYYSNGTWPSSDHCNIEDPSKELSAIMFCSSLRRRKEWAQLVPALLRSTSPGWKGTLKANSLGYRASKVRELTFRPIPSEINLHSHDVAFALPPQSQHHQPRVSFKLILLSSEEAKAAEATAKIERLSMLNGGQNVTIFLLLDGSGRVDSLVHLQMR
jgi:hypothetical protein